MPIDNDDELRRILAASKVVATVGVSGNPDKPSYGIFAYLADHGYHMIPINPGTPEIQGLKTYADLSSVPEKIDVVQIFRKAEDVPPVVEEAIRVGARTVWMQEGIVNEEAARAAEAAGLQVVMDRCMRVTHRRLFGTGKVS